MNTATILTIIVGILIAAILLSQPQHSTAPVPTPTAFARPTGIPAEVSTPKTGPTATAGTRTATAAPTKAANPTEAGEGMQAYDENGKLLPEYVQSPCGDGKCSWDETCGSCTQDCACRSAEVCGTTLQACVPKEFCGDGKCDETEGSSGACPNDCGCPQGEKLYQPTGECIRPLPLTEAQAAKVAQKLLNTTYANYSYNKTTDEIFDGKPAKQLIFSCDPDPGYPCYAFVYVDAQGRVLGEETSN